MKKTVRGWDKALQLSMTPFFIALLVIPGLEVVRYNWTHIPIEMKLVGFITLILSLTIFFFSDARKHLSFKSCGNSTR